MPQDALGNTAPEWLSDNRSLVHYTSPFETPSLKRLDTETGEVAHVASGNFTWSWTCSHDGRLLYLERGKMNFVRLFPLNGGQEKQLLQSPGRI